MSEKENDELNDLIRNENYITNEHPSIDKMKGCWYIFLTGAVVLIIALIIIFCS